MTRRMTVRPTWLLGKKIVGVELTLYDNTNHTGWKEQEIVALTLDDGARLAFMACESESDPFVSPIYTKGPGKGRRKKKPSGA